MRIKNISLTTIIYIICIALVSLFRIYIQIITPLYPRILFGVDDLLMVRYADLLGKNGKFLGEYNFYTLNKLPGYAFFLWLNDKLNTPYSFLYGVFLVIACLIFMYAVYLYYKDRKKAFICFLFVLFCPVLVSHDVFGRVYCIALVPILTILIAAAYIGIIAQRSDYKKMLIWIILAGITYGSYSITRYDSIWMTLFIVGITLVLIIFSFKENKGIGKTKNIIYVSIYLIPILIGVFFTNALCLTNYLNYGIYAKTDFNDSHFAEMCKLLMDIEQDEEVAGVYVTMDAINKAAENSEKFKELVDNRNQVGWDGVLENGEINIDIYAWDLRYAADALGWYADAKTAESNYGEICQDLQNAFASGNLKKRNIIAVSPFSAPFRMEDISRMIKYSVQEGVYDVVTFKGVMTDTKIMEENSDGLEAQLFENYTNEELISPDEIGITSLSGWLMASSDETNIKVYLVDGEKRYPVEFQPSDDVYSVYGVEQAKNARFAIELTDENRAKEPLKIEIVNEDGDVNCLSLAEFAENKTAIQGCLYNIDNYAYVGKDNKIDSKLKLEEKTCKTVNCCIARMGKISFVMFEGSIIAIIMDIVLLILLKFIKSKEDCNFVIISLIVKLGLLISMWAIIMLQSERNFMTLTPFLPSSSSGAYILYAIYLGLCICTVFENIAKIKNLCIKTKEQK